MIASSNLSVRGAPFRWRSVFEVAGFEFAGFEVAVFEVASFESVKGYLHSSLAAVLCDLYCVTMLAITVL